MINHIDLLTKAIQIRKQLGEDSNSPIDIFALSQNIDRLTIVFFPMGKNLSGICVKNSKDNQIIAINSLMSLGRQRFSLAHELYHLFFDETMVSVCAQKFDIDTEIEQKANIFASYFLAPPSELENKARTLALKNEDKKLKLDDIIRIEQFFGMSHQATLIRLKETEFLNTLDADSLFLKGVKRRALELGFRADLYLPSKEEEQYKTYGYYIDQVQKLYNLDLISTGKYEELLLDAFRADLVYTNQEEGELID